MVWQYVRWLESRSFRNGENTALFRNSHDSVSHRRDICACNNPSSIIHSCIARHADPSSREFNPEAARPPLANQTQWLVAVVFLKRVNVFISIRIRVAYVKLSQMDSHLNGHSYSSRKISSREDEKRKDGARRKDGLRSAGYLNSTSPFSRDLTRLSLMVARTRTWQRILKIRILSNYIYWDASFYS